VGRWYASAARAPDERTVHLKQVKTRPEGQYVTTFSFVVGFVASIVLVAASALFEGSLFTGAGASATSTGEAGTALDLFMTPGADGSDR
jgi:hypothetical protein